MSQSKLTKAEAAERLNCTPKSIERWCQEGMPRMGTGRAARYPWPEILLWRDARRERQIRAEYDERDPDELDLETERARLVAAQARLAELELAQAEAKLVTVEYADAREAARLQRLRAKLLAFPSRWAPRLVGLRSIAEAQLALEPAITEAMQSLSETAEDEGPDDADDDTRRTA